VLVEDGALYQDKPIKGLEEGVALSDSKLIAQFALEGKTLWGQLIVLLAALFWLLLFPAK
jgi:hypothetical protein